MSITVAVDANGADLGPSEVAVGAVADGEADAFVSGGSTGPALAAGLFNIRRARGIHRPALAIPVPVPEHPVIIVDVGANVEVRPEHLVQFGFMGAALAETLLDVERPRIGLLSIGEEAVKGTPLVVETHAALRDRVADGDTYDFVGNVEGNEVPMGKADVIVTDGFTGNVVLKLMEGVSEAMLRNIRRVAESSR